MNPSRVFILRPVATTMLMVGILLAGAVGYMQLPVSALPEVDYPIIQVTTFYPGASPDVMASSVTAPLERQFGQVPGLLQMTSTSSDGSSVITLQFNLSLSIDVAEQEVQQSINASGTYLPADLPAPPIYSKTNPADTPILTLALTSTELPLSKVEDLADTRLAPKMSQLPGVGLVSISGGQKPAVRIQANPTAMASYGLNLEDLRTAIVAANVNQAKGNFDGANQAYQIGANDQLLSSARAPTSSPKRPAWWWSRSSAPPACWTPPWRSAPSRDRWTTCSTRSTAAWRTINACSSPPSPNAWRKTWRSIIPRWACAAATCTRKLPRWTA